jgi:hypothetical protein
MTYTLTLKKFNEAALSLGIYMRAGTKIIENKYIKTNEDLLKLINCFKARHWTKVPNWQALASDDMIILESPPFGEWDRYEVRLPNTVEKGKVIIL